MLRGNLQKRLADARAELARVRENLKIVEEQVAYLQDVTDEAQTDAIVSETPLSHRQHREADADLQRLRRQRDELRATITALQTEQDALLDRLLETR